MNSTKITYMIGIGLGGFFGSYFLNCGGPPNIHDFYISEILKKNNKLHENYTDITDYINKLNKLRGKCLKYEQYSAQYRDSDYSEGPFSDGYHKICYGEITGEKNNPLFKYREIINYPKCYVNGVSRWNGPRWYHKYIKSIEPTVFAAEDKLENLVCDLNQAKAFNNKYDNLYMLPDSRIVTQYTATRILSDSTKIYLPNKFRIVDDKFCNCKNIKCNQNIPFHNF